MGSDDNDVNEAWPEFQKRAREMLRADQSRFMQELSKTMAKRSENDD
jgi:hypothetical protein